MTSEKQIGIPQLSKGKRAWVLFALALTIFFNNGDSTLVSTASAGIIGAIGGAELYALIFTVKMISNTIIVSFSGRLIDKFGRRNMLLLGVAIITITYIGSGLATTMPILILWRFLAGIGSGLMFSTAYTMLGELASSSSKTGLTYMINVIAGGLAMVVSPMIAAWVVTNLTWKWAFWAFVPLAVIAFIIVAIVLPNYKFGEQGAKTDTAGIIYISLALSALSAVFGLAGSYLQWSSPFTLGLLAVGVVFFVLFIMHERKVDENIAVLPVNMVKSKVAVGCMVGQFTMTLNSVCLLSYVAYYMQAAMQRSPTEAGLSSSIMYGLSTVGGVIILALMTKTQNFRLFGRVTVFGEAVALVLFYVFLSPTMPIGLMFALVIFYGVMASVEGYAFVMTFQLTLSKARMAVGTTLIIFMQSIAAVVGTAISGAIVNSSADFASGVKNVYLFAAIVTVIGAVTYTLLVPKTEVIKEMGAKAQAQEDAELKAAA